jgi:hypothetical protein
VSSFEFPVFLGLLQHSTVYTDVPKLETRNLKLLLWKTLWAAIVM